MCNFCSKSIQALVDIYSVMVSLQWRHNERDGLSIHQPYDCLLNRLLRRRSTKTSKLRVTGLCAGNSPVTGEFPAQTASNAESISIWWRHNGWIGQNLLGIIIGIVKYVLLMDWNCWDHMNWKTVNIITMPRYSLSSSWYLIYLFCSNSWYLEIKVSAVCWKVLWSA